MRFLLPRPPVPRAAVYALAVAVTATAPVAAQLSLRDALHAADQTAFGNRAAAGATAAQQAQTVAPLRGVLPALRIESGYLRTTDPVGTFGTALRQRAITPADFDPARLNYPAAVGNYQAGVVLEQPLLNADAWAGRRAAMQARDATVAQQQWTIVTTHADVIRAYYGAVLAAERASTLASASAAAHAHVTQAESMVKDGIATKSDALLAAVRAGEIDIQWADAQGAVRSMAAALQVALGHDPATSAVLPALLPPTTRIREVVAPDTVAEPIGVRADVSAAKLGVDAAQSDALRANSAYAPRLNAFARYDWNSATNLYGGDKNWTVGVMATWSPFGGPAEVADAGAARGREAAARAQADAAVARSRLEADQTRTALVVALTRLEIAERAVVQSAEAHRIIARKYEGGLATIVELLDAQAAETQSALALEQSRAGAIVAAADHRLALGRDPASLAAIEDRSAVAAIHDFDR
ncbi:MAG: TolC family protein [Gemmatimonadaceae bacterium]